MKTLMEWFSHVGWTGLAGVAAAWLLAFRALADLTPTQSDNAIVQMLYNLFAILGVKVPDNTGTA